MSFDFTYDGTLYNLGRFGLGIYINQMVVVAAEIGASGLCVWLVPNLRRKISTAVGLALRGMLMLSIVIMNFQGFEISTVLKAYVELALFVAMRFFLGCVCGV